MGWAEKLNLREIKILGTKKQISKILVASDAHLRKAKFSSVRILIFRNGYFGG